MAKPLRIVGVLAVLLAARAASAQSESFDPVPSTPPGAAPAEAPSDSTAAAEKRCHLMLNDGSHLIGTLELGKEIAFESAIGEVSLPVEKIAEIHFTDPPNCRIRFYNDDQLSGSLALMTVKLTTIWGVAEVELQHISSIFSERARQNQMQPAYAPSPYGTGSYSAPASGYYRAPPPAGYSEAVPAYAPTLPAPPLPAPIPSPASE